MSSRRIFCGIENQEGPLMSKAVVDILGNGVLMYQSDYPHPESLFPMAADLVGRWSEIRPSPHLNHLTSDVWCFGMSW
jgi:hypothetical protein